MVDEITPRLVEWTKSDSAKLVILKGEGDRSLCAGGDVAALAKAIADEGTEGSKKATHYFKAEYVLDQYIATYPKPFIALMDGITMGGGVGLSVHAPFRIATERTLFAMPETTIGFWPDVGGSYFLSRLDGQLGAYLGLTSNRLKGLDVFYSGIATHYVPSHLLPELEARLCELHSSVSDANVEFYSLVNSAIQDFTEELPKDYVFSLAGEKREIIDSCFGHDTIEEILAALENHPSSFAKEAKEIMEKRSPTSLKVTLASIRQSRNLDITAALRKDYHIAENFTYHPDFVEGVSSLLLTKPPKTPVWKASGLGDVSPADVESFFVKRSDDPSPEIEFLNDKSYKEYPHHYSLPSEQEVEDYVIGNGSSREFKATRKEIIDHFAKAYKGKAGIEHKVNEILSRKTKPDPSDEALLDWNY
jgi:3-hydroxyisobutyryl-CoA hydrolase